MDLKGQFTQKVIQYLSSFNHPQVVPDLYEFRFSDILCYFSVIKVILKNVGNQTVAGSH